MAPPFDKPYIQLSPKRVRVLFAGVFVVDTRKAQLVWEKPFYPTYFFSSSDLSSSYFQPSKESPPSEGTRLLDLVVGERHAPAAVTSYEGTETGQLRGLVKLAWTSADAWFEEDEQVFVHPKDPYKRVDVLQSSRHVRVEAQGIVIAETRRPRLLFETLLRVRTYIPKTDCNLQLLVPSETTTECPYKGVANYYNVHLPSGEVLKDVVWWYRTPQPECGEIKGFAAFYDEKLDVFVDGEKQPR